MEHEDALRASLLAVYGVRLSARSFGVLELADLVTHLPPGCALWRAAGGELAWSDEVHMLAKIELGVRVLAWQQTEDGQKGRRVPEPVDPPRASGEVRAEEAVADRKAEAWQRRQKRRAGGASAEG